MIAHDSLPPLPPFPWRSVDGHQVRLLRDGSEAFPAMVEAISEARDEVCLEMYWIGADAVGERFRDALAKAADRGVRVRVIYDAVGSLAMTTAWWEPVLRAGGEVHPFRGVLSLMTGETITRFEERDHRKLLVVDGEVAFAGGINLTTHWLPRSQGGEGWRDDAIALRGPVAADLRILFFRTWKRMTGERIPSLGAVDQPRPKLRAWTSPRTGPSRHEAVWPLATHGHLLRSVRREYLLRIREARERIDIANAYFVPDLRVLRALLEARRRGVRVRVVVPEHADVPLIKHAVEATFDVLLRHGVEVYALPRPMLHAKTALVDDHFVTIGSYNLDHRSWRKNLELNIAVLSTEFAADVRLSLERDIALAQAVTLESWRRRPLLRRGLEWVTRRMQDLW